MYRRLRVVGRKAVTIALVLTLMTFVLPFFLTHNVRAADDDQYIWGMIFTSDGTLLPYDTNFRVWVLHNTTWMGFPSNTTWDPTGTMGGFYSYTLPWDQKEINWTHGDLYRIQIDCTPSGDLAENATSNGTGSPGEFSPRGSYNNIINWSTGGGENNSQEWDVMCSNVDLIPTNIKLNGVPYSPPMAVAPFTTVTISSDVSNVGKTDISEPNTIVLRNQSGVLGQDTAVTINSGASVGPFNFTWDAPASGFFCFNITVDYYDNVTEIDEYNNTEMVCFNVGEADLTPSGVWITTDYVTQSYIDVSLTNYRSNLIPITPGTTATIIANVSNVGTLSSGPSDVGFYNTTGEGGPIVGFPFGIPFLETIVTPLNPGSLDGPFVTTWTAPATPGNYYVNITADYNNDLVEISEVNNTFILRFLVGNPDYIPWNVSPTSPQNVTSATWIPIDSYVRNVGILYALSGSTIAFYNQSDRANPFGSANVVNLSAGDTSAQAYSANWLAHTVTSVTPYYVVIEVDYDFDIVEANELNNTHIIEFMVHPGPVTTLEYGDPNYVNGTGSLYITSSTSLDFDVQSEVDWAHTHYFVDGVGPSNYSNTGTFTIPDEGLHNITFYSFDSLGNQEATHTQAVIVDDSPPITTLNIFGRKIIQGGTTYVRSNPALTPIYLNWTRDDEPDLAVGREVTRYRIYQVIWGSWTDYIPGNPINLGSGDGTRQIEWFSVDYLGNNETVQSATVFVDDTPPTTSIAIGEPSHERDHTLYIEETTEITLSASDAGCGVNIIEYRLDDGGWEQYTGAIKIKEPGEHTIYFRSTDNLDNTEETQSEQVFVIGPNYKPIIAIIFIIIMIIVGAIAGHKRPLLMARKKIREVEEELLKEEEELEEEVLDDEEIKEYPVEVEAEPEEYLEEVEESPVEVEPAEYEDATDEEVV